MWDPLDLAGICCLGMGVASFGSLRVHSGRERIGQAWPWPSRHLMNWHLGTDFAIGFSGRVMFIPRIKITETVHPAAGI